MNAGLGKPSPSHPAETVASFPCAKDLLDPATNALDRLIKSLKARLCFGFVPSPHAGGNDTWRSTLGGMPPPKAVCPDFVIGFKSMPYVMRYNHFPY
ncbi:hypothetical protein C8J37_12817 [Rhizobium sp. PP-WC-1G-195]|nr:hypothetical protein C8J37_12817 [Rhizobium sp. PP-WC-1G-195]TCQ02827.1 hypothetical protein C8J34_11548 [Rhizobium sp. PP-F2F-G36]